MSEIRVNKVVNSTGDNDSGLDMTNNDEVLIKTANTTAITVNASQNVTMAGNVTVAGDFSASSLNGGQFGGRRNIVINGAMNVAQRGTSTSSYTADGYSVCDRWMYRVSGLGTWTISQDSTTPNGFGNSTKWDCTTADASPAVGDTLMLSQRLEGQDLQQLKKGLSDAENVTLSFYVNSVKTGTYIVELYDVDNTRHISKSYTINVANTWEYKTITFEGDTSGAFGNDNARSLDINFWLGSGTNFTSGTLATSWASVTSANRAVGQVNLGDSTDNNFFITGVQLEVGSVATTFEHRSFGEELALCQRYYWHTYSYGSPAGTTFNQDYEAPIIIIGTGNHGMGVCNGVYPVEMRASPTVSFYGSDGTANRIRYWNSGSLSTYSTVNRSTRQILGMSLGAGSNPEDFYSAALVCDAEL